MTYAKWAAERYSHLEEHISKMEKLQPGEKLELIGTSNELDSIRSKLYEYLFHLGLKKHFRLIRTSPTSLEVKRQGVSSVTSMKKSPTLPAYLDSIMRELIMGTEDEVLPRLRRHLANRTITSAEMGLLIERYDTAMRRPDGDDETQSTSLDNGGERW